MFIAVFVRERNVLQPALLMVSFRCCRSFPVNNIQSRVSQVYGTRTSNDHMLESAGLNALEELLRCWECTEKIVNPACVL